MLEKFLSDKAFLVVGRAGMDLYPDPPGSRTEDAIKFQAELGGSSANIAVALSRFDQSASLLTCVSDDSIGRFVRNQLSNYGVNAELVRTVSGDMRTSLALVESRVEDHQSVIYRNNAADFQMDMSQVDSVDLSPFKALVITGTCLTLQPSREASMHILQRAKAAGLITVLDLDYRPYSWQSATQAQEVYHSAVELIDMVVGNDEEFGHMAGSYEAGETLAKNLSKHGKMAIYKRGQYGSRTYIPEGKVIETSVFPVKPLKPTGAGDSFLGGLLASLSSEDSLETALKKGSACAALVVTRVGCAPAMPDQTELEAFMAEYQA